MDPPVSVPKAIGTISLATTTPLADEDPPGDRAGPVPLGLRGVPKCGFNPMPEYANSVMFSAPTVTKPARAPAFTKAASCAAGGLDASTTEPAVVTLSFRSNRSFHAT
ncbi:MAG: hypothetical protein ACD_54C01097G0001, partial [uncultured bacterium]